MSWPQPGLIVGETAIGGIDGFETGRLQFGKDTIVVGAKWDCRLGDAASYDLLQLLLGLNDFGVELHRRCALRQSTWFIPWLPISIPLCSSSSMPALSM